MMNDKHLVLISANKSRSRDDDYDVRVGDTNGPILGRIFRAPQSPKDRPWFWTISERAPQKPTSRGYAPTREEAMADFKAAWEREP